MKKFAGDIIILHMCTKNHNHMVPEIRSDTDIIFCRFGPFFALLPPHPQPLTIPKIKILKKNEKKHLEILSFYTYNCTINENHMIYGS